MPEQRIQKALADAGVASRRAAEALVAAGRVTVNGVRADVGQRVDPGADAILVDGRPLSAPSERMYLALAKPAGVTSTVSDRHADRTVVDLVPREVLARAGRIYPVGRLDRDSEGLILLTNDGDWAQRILHPSHGVEREYAVGLDRPLDADQAARLTQGIELEEGSARVQRLRHATDPEARSVEAFLGDAGRLVWYRAVLTQGWRRQLRRMFAAVDAPVRRLVRLRMGTVRLDGLRMGEVRQLSARERGQLVGLSRTMVSPGRRREPPIAEPGR